MDTCRGCNTAIIWAITPKGSSMPLDARAMDPSPPLLPPVGSYYVREEGGRVFCEPANVNPTPGRPVHMNHWSTCPKRDQFKRGGQAHYDTAARKAGQQ